LNAAVEAARAGEAKREIEGAVQRVASLIGEPARRLADSSAVFRT
jgi:hypothetical protein